MWSVCLLAQIMPFFTVSQSRYASKTRLLMKSRSQTRGLSCHELSLGSAKQSVCCGQTLHPTRSMSPNWYTDVCAQEYCSCAWHFHTRVESSLSHSQHLCHQNEVNGWCEKLKFDHRVSPILFFFFKKRVSSTKSRWKMQIKVDLQMSKERSWPVHAPTRWFFWITPPASEWTEILAMWFGWSGKTCDSHLWFLLHCGATNYCNL